MNKSRILNRGTNTISTECLYLVSGMLECDEGEELSQDDETVDCGCTETKLFDGNYRTENRYF